MSLADELLNDFEDGEEEELLATELQARENGEEAVNVCEGDVIPGQVRGEWLESCECEGAGRVVRELWEFGEGNV